MLANMLNVSTVHAHGLQSPASPFHGQHSRQSPYQPRYQTSPQPDTMPSSAARGLGLQVPTTLPSNYHQQATVTSMSPSPMLAAHSFQQPAHHVSQQQPPDIFSSALDPFSGFISGTPSSPEAPGLDFCPTPSSAQQPSHRSSISSSYAPSDGSDCSYTPRMKNEENAAWYASTGSEHILQRQISAANLYTPQPANMLTSPSDEYYRTPQTAEWPKADSSTYLSVTVPNTVPRVHTSMHPGSRFAPEGTPFLGAVGDSSRIKKKRQRTTAEEATHNCGECGKLFKRSYNYKSHMETHNPNRKYPHPCTAEVNGVMCAKRFQRKTDLDRHVDSVHLKTRNHKCQLCGNCFARRDTLRRHTEDGCPKRFDLGLRSGDMTGGAASSFPPPPGHHHQHQDFTSPNSSTTSPGGASRFLGSGSASNATFPMLSPYPMQQQQQGTRSRSFSAASTANDQWGGAWGHTGRVNGGGFVS